MRLARFHSRRKDQRDATHSHGYSHVSFGYRIHRRTNEGCIKGNVASDFGLDGDIAGSKVDPPGQKQKIVIGKTAMDFRVH